MEPRLKLFDKNIFPLGGILVKSSSPTDWLKEMQWMGLSLSANAVYAIPGLEANSVWGCLIEVNLENKKIDTSKNLCCQLINNTLFIPEKSILFPKISNEEISSLFHKKKHIFHPEFGLVELEEKVDWGKLLQLPDELQIKVRQPQPSLFIPGRINAYLVHAAKAEDALQELESRHFPKKEKFKDKPLNLFEKIKLFIYKGLFNRKPGVGGSGSGPTESPLVKFLEGIRRFFSNTPSNWMNRLEQDYEDLERRNQKEVDKLMDLLKKNPGEALKYAIPLDPEGTARGNYESLFRLQKRWFDFSLFGNTNFGNRGGSVFSPSAFAQLSKQYHDTAQELIKQNEFRKAAFVYMKLLKNYLLAAQTLEQGGLYEEAASVYLKYLQYREKAAQCYEKGKMYMNAIELYIELGENEKVGDLYNSMHKKKEALQYYQKVANAYIQHHHYVKAALLSKNKMENEAAAQEILLKGWRSNSDAFNCLNNYFANIKDVKQLGNEIHSIYQKEVDRRNREVFLRVLKYEYDKKNDLAGSIKEMAHEIIVAQVPHNPSIVAELRAFNKTDKELIKDTIRFKIGLNKDH